jgi:hypothetical protein
LSVHFADDEIEAQEKLESSWEKREWNPDEESDPEW